MLFHTHIVFGVFLAIVFFPYMGSAWIAIPAIIIGSIIVDIDAPTSKVGKSILLRPMQWCVKHRGFFHSLIACILFSLGLGVWNQNLGKAFFVGYLGHLFLDGLTKEGVRLFWPFELKASGPFKTGGVGESLVFTSFLILDIALIFMK